MKVIIILILCLFLNFTKSVCQIKLSMNCEAELINDSLEIKLKFSNFIDSSITNDYEIDNNNSIFITISEWIIEGNPENSGINGLDWINSHLINLIAYIPSQFIKVVEPISMADYDYFEFFIKYLPKFAEIKQNDSLILRLNYKLTGKHLIMNDRYKIFIQIPYLSGPQIYEIATYADRVIGQNYVNYDYERSDLFNYFLDLQDNYQKEIFININEKETKSVVNRNYSNFTNIIIDEAIRRMLRIAIISNILECNCKINSKK